MTYIFNSKKKNGEHRVKSFPITRFSCVGDSKEWRKEENGMSYFYTACKTLESENEESYCHAMPG